MKYYVRGLRKTFSFWAINVRYRVFRHIEAMKVRGGVYEGGQVR